MKRKLFIRGVLTSILLLMVLIISSCENFYPSKVSHTETDSAFVVKQIADAHDPLFVTVQDAVNYQILMNEESFVDSVFKSLNPDVLRNVATVLSKTGANLTKKAIVYEFRQHRNIYTNLETSPKSLNKQEILQSADLGSRHSDTVINSSKDTVYIYVSSQTPGYTQEKR